jgi:hypothetical protein
MELAGRGQSAELAPQDRALMSQHHAYVLVTRRGTIVTAPWRGAFKDALRRNFDTLGHYDAEHGAWVFPSGFDKTVTEICRRVFKSVTVCREVGYDRISSPTSEKDE